jgi:hypothetical protein
MLQNNLTAVDWLEQELAKNIKEIIKNGDAELMEKLFDDARRLELSQIILARISAPNLNTLDINDYINEAEKYYKSKYE